MAGFNKAALQRLRDTFSRDVDRGRIPGAVLLVSSHGHDELFEAVGFQDAEAGTPMAPDAIFRIYSMTKPIVSLMALMLVEDGKLALIDPVAKYIPSFGALQVATGDGKGRIPLERQPTVHDLLRHTAGMTYDLIATGPVSTLYEKARIGDRELTNEEFCRDLSALPLVAQPGTRWEYSRATDVLGAVLEVVTGSTLGALLRERILGPLGMNDTAFSVPAQERHRVAEPFAKDPDTGEASWLYGKDEEPKFESGGGGLLSTAADYRRFLQLMRNRGTVDGVRLVSRKTIEWMTADHIGDIPRVGDTLPPGHGFGLGFAVRTHAGMANVPGSVGLYYWSGVAGTSFFIDPQEDLFAMLLIQAPNQRLHYRLLFRQLVYAAVD